MVTHVDQLGEPAGDELADGSFYLNRELSWLEFNARVLALADDPQVPLLERVKFLAIFSSNLDEFFQVRVAALKDQVAAHVGSRSPDGRTAAQQLEEISDRVGALVSQQEEIYHERVKPALAAAGIWISDWDDLDEEDRKYLIDVYEQRIFPVLTPLSFDPGHPFPYISNLSLNLGVTVSDPDTGERRFARVKVPPLLPRFVITPDGERFVPLEQVIAVHLSTLFLGMEVVDFVPFRVTRNADLTLEEEEADDLLAAVEMELRRRRFGRAVRLEVDHRMSAEMLELLLRELDLEPDDVSFHHGPLDLSGLWSVHALPRPDLKDEPWMPVTPPSLADAADGNRSIFSVIRNGDLLMHHPYDSFATSVEEFIRQASIDPAVLAIKMTLYRTSGDSPIVASLIRAAEQGKQVAALVELKARFDEQTNIAWAKALEQVGVHVVYGLMGLKTHTKTALVIREEAGALRRYCHVGTGNYNSDTARLYEDLGLLSADPDLGADLIHLFNHLTGYSREVKYRKLIVAPRWLRPKVQDLILNEAKAGREGRIIIKMNSLVDPAMIDALCTASQAGVEIDLIIRGICCLRPGVPGLSDNIRVRSIVGRYLEHSRIYYFANGAGSSRPMYFIGSADLMERNLDRRVEALAPVEAPALQARLQEVLDVSLTDDVLAWQLDGVGKWSRVPTVDQLDAHRRLQELALARARA
ncbi:MAG TPA: RNA degradosome polyphosphate kinase [Acidimicrobiales bacterium]|nr:RNA degradosome polyphosphate kinase [Acidimicrobiales bacterium]